MCDQVQPCKTCGDKRWVLVDRPADDYFPAGDHLEGCPDCNWGDAPNQERKPPKDWRSRKWNRIPASYCGKYDSEQYCKDWGGR